MRLTRASALGAAYPIYSPTVILTQTEPEYLGIRPRLEGSAGALGNLPPPP